MDSFDRLDNPSPYPVTNTGGFVPPPSASDWIEKPATVLSCFTAGPAKTAAARTPEAAIEIAGASSRGIEIPIVFQTLSALGFTTDVITPFTMGLSTDTRTGHVQVVVVPYDMDSEASESVLKRARRGVGRGATTIVAIERPPEPRGYYAERSTSLEFVEEIRNTGRDLVRPFYYDTPQDLAEAVRMTLNPTRSRPESDGYLVTGPGWTRLSYSLVGIDYLGLARDAFKCFADAKADMVDLRLRVLPNRLCSIAVTACVPGTKADANRLLNEVWMIMRPPESPIVTDDALREVSGELVTAYTEPGSGRLIRLLNLLPRRTNVLDIEVRRVNRDGKRIDNTTIRVDVQDTSPAEWQAFRSRLQDEHGRNGISHTFVRSCHDWYGFGIA